MATVHEIDSKPRVGLAPSSVPPQQVAYQLASGHYYSHAIALVAKLGVADLLGEGPRAVADLAAATGTHAPALMRVLRLLASVGVFEEKDNGEFTLTPVGECLREGVPGSMRAGVMLFGGEFVRENWNELEYCLRTGEPAFRAKGLDSVFAALARSPKEAANFDAAMANITSQHAVAVTAAYDFAPFNTMIDVGGGNGTLMIAILKAHSHLRAIVCDRPEVAQRATAEIARNGLSGRCHAEGCDIFKQVSAGGDAYVLKHVLHSFDDERAASILQVCRKAMRSGAKLLVIEGVYPRRIDQSSESRGAAANDVNMLVSTGGRQRSEAEFCTLFQSASFELRSITPTRTDVGVHLDVIEGVPSA